MTKVRVATSQRVDKSLDQRALVVGLTINDSAKAYPFDALLKQNLIIDDLARVPIFIALGDDKKSVRAYERSIDGRKLEFFVKPGAAPLRLVDAETGSEWDFTGKAIGGALSGRQLQKVAVLSDYWFDWRSYHQNTKIYQLGNR